ncbi:MAG: hypothetical protein Faunusvirus32_3 [Faunusvirus sp.]|jgi:hypothetical protein|uniref:SET domain-containing protein n=1 Tax=Faunusvirus sp. TaxID=2487766 RepID=A0A3G5A048_9VIRU|nr:MAG: hypothetical protein Faunusvirus32_3 [Faunusvirus sp.]
MDTQSLTQKFDILAKWVRDNGGTVSDKLSIQQTDVMDRFVAASNDIDPNEELLNIPNKICITKDKISSVPNFEQFDIDSMSDKFKLLIILMYNIQLGEASFFKHYIKLLPTLQYFNNHPLYQFTDENRIQWQHISPSFVALLSALNQECIDCYSKLATFNKTTAVFSQDSLSIENVKWCYLLILTRSWRNTGLVPIADMLQHSNHSTMILNNGSEKNSLTTQNIIKSGEIVYDNYCINDELMQFAIYGFVDDIENMTVRRYINIALPKKDIFDNTTVLNRFKNGELNNYIASHAILYMTNAGIHTSLLEYLRVNCMDETDMQNINLSKDGKPYYSSIISLTNESRVYTNILSLIKKGNIVDDDKKLGEYKSIIDNANNVGNTDSVIYKLAKIGIYRNQIIHTTCETVVTLWNKFINNPFGTEIKLSIN